MSDSDATQAIETLEPAPVWQLFAGLARVPRPSKKEQRVRTHVRQVAEGRGLTVREDPSGNLLIEVPASPGHEDAPVTVLQGHLDMVCEKNSGTKHDFDNDPIRLVLDRHHDGQTIVRADGTTLGADNGIGVCMALAAASIPDVIHGPLELLLTIDEEAGMTGAKALEPGFFLGKRLINLDSEEDDVLYIGCAGGCDTNLSWTFQLEPIPADARAYRIEVTGLRGGHSGCDIHENRGNAIKLLAQTLAELRAEPFRFVEISGGSLRNAIPREAQAVVIGAADLAQVLTDAAGTVQARAASACGEPNAKITVSAVNIKAPGAATNARDSLILLEALLAIPHGVLAVVPEIPGLVETSNSLSTLTTKPGSEGNGIEICAGCLSRSSSADRIAETVRRLHAVGELAHATVNSGNDYPGWQPNPDSPALAACRDVYRRLFSETPNVTAIHAGLECGIIGERMGGGLDMVSFGPRIEGAHSPDERVFVDSVQKSWRFLQAVLKEFAT